MRITGEFRDENSLIPLSHTNTHSLSLFLSPSYIQFRSFLSLSTAMPWYPYAIPSSTIEDVWVFFYSIFTSFGLYSTTGADDTLHHLHHVLDTLLRFFRALCVCVQLSMWRLVILVIQSNTHKKRRVQKKDMWHFFSLLTNSHSHLTFFVLFWMKWHFLLLDYQSPFSIFFDGAKWNYGVFFSLGSMSSLFSYLFFIVMQ